MGCLSGERESWGEMGRAEAKGHNGRRNPLRQCDGGKKAEL